MVGIDYYCDVCSAACGNEHNFANHVKGRRHKLATKEKLFCEVWVCAVSVHNETSLEQRLAGKRHLRNVRKSPKHEPIETSDGTNGYVCELCDVVCFSGHFLTKHFHGKKHRLKLLMNRLKENRELIIMGWRSRNSFKKISCIASEEKS